MAAGPGAFGPYLHRNRFRVLLRARDGEESYHSFATKTAAEEFRVAAAEEVAAEKAGERTVADAITAYAQHLRDKGNKKTSLDETPRRLRWFFAPYLIDPVDTLHRRQCAKRYDEITRAINPRTAKPYAVDTHRNTLSECRSFLAWCVEHRWLRSNALDGVKGKGKRKRGKAQLRIDECRAWTNRALKLAKSEPGAVAALCSCVLGMRASEIVSRVVRDLDDSGRLLWIPDSKTEAGKRTLEVPEMLRPLLVRLARNRGAEEQLFGRHWRDWPRAWVKRICRAADVPPVTAHGMRGFFATVGVAHGAAHMVAAALGHETPETTMQHYASAGVADAAQRRAAMTVLAGGVSQRVTRRKSKRKT